MWSVLLWTLYFDYKYKTNWQEENRNYWQQQESIKMLGRNVHTKMISQNRSLQTQRTPSLKMSHWTCHLHMWRAKANSSARPTRLPLLAIQIQRETLVKCSDASRKAVENQWRSQAHRPVCDLCRNRRIATIDHRRRTSNLVAIIWGWVIPKVMWSLKKSLPFRDLKLRSCMVL